MLKAVGEDEEEHEYKSEGLGRLPNCNPPSEILYMTMLQPKMEAEVRKLFESVGCPAYAMEWRQNKDKWMCLVELGSLNESMYVMGKLQGAEVGGKKMRLSFTRSRMKKYQSPSGSKFAGHFS